ncbi:WD repeat-containing protein 74 [Trametes pubescens]|uniref:Ribosome biogenesis protein NSA1 n=1 Tax=Trametes pubescens TaxID=154538 RepID=A0A1M2W7C0_TRAPU|nr:WD repeat-containing protein 74 [Trametes pubescens]
MPHFFSGDELGAIKSVSYAQGEKKNEWKPTTTILVPGSTSGRSKTVQKLAVHSAGSETLLSALRADGSASLYEVTDETKLSVVHEWSEPRLKDGQRFVGLANTESGVYSCTSNGALRLTKPGENSAEPSSSLAVLPTRLFEWRLSSDNKTFAYGGDEVELSLWDTEKAFSQPQEAAPQNASADTKKRKRSDQLLPGELWRAKNVPNDHLSLRQPVHNTALTYLQPSTSAVQQHLLVGTANGGIRRYDTRAARRPVADWKGIGKTGGVSTVEKGFNDHEVFVADRGCLLAALDLRNGRTIYSYKGLAGAVSSIAPAHSLLASAAQDRFVRLHSTFSPPAEARAQQERKGDVLDKLYMKVTPTVVVWDGQLDVSVGNAGEAVDEDDVWDAMPVVDSDSEDEGKPDRRKKKTGPA